MASIYHPRYPSGKESPYYNVKCWQRGRNKHHYLALKYPDGRRVRNRRDALYYKAKHEQLCGHRVTKEGPLHLRPLLLRFIDEAVIQEQKKPTTAAIDRLMTERLCAYLGAQRPVSQLSADMLDATLVRLMADRGLTAVTRNNYRKLLRSFGRWCKFRGYTLEDFAQDLPKLKEKPRSKAWLTRERWGDLLLLAEAARHPKLYLFTALGLFTGLRRGSLLALEWRDLDLAGEQLTARAEIMKDGEPLRIPVHRELQPILLRYAARHGLLFADLTPRGVDYHLKPLLRQLGLQGPRLGSHTLRRSFVKAALQALSADEARDAVGHASLDTTDTYAERQVITTEQMNRI